jgi:hypothetical protein
LVTLDTCDEQSLIAAEASGLYQPTRCQLENVAMHRAGHALAVSIPFAQTRTRMIAGILYGAWNGVDKRNEYVERRMGEPNHVTRLKPRER